MNSEHRITFCTLFSVVNEHLTKDLGLIPYGMHKYEGCDSFMATYDNGDYPNLKYLPGLRMELIPRRTNNFKSDAVLWLRKNAKRIGILNLYHAGMFSLLLTVLFKTLNSRGKVYLKLDGCPGKRNSRAANSLFRRFLKIIFVGLQMKLSDCVSTELQGNDELLSRDWKRSVIFIPNPANPNELHDFRPFRERSNTILYVGRVEREKGSHTLLEAFAKIAQQISEWSMRLVGRITEQDIVDDFIAAYPELRGRVIFTGAVSDRGAISEEYMNAKIFAFPSRRESFGIALMEAMMQGCFTVTTNILASSSLTDNFRYALGSDVDDVDGLAHNLLYACTHEDEIESLAREGRDATLRRCDLKTCCDKIADSLA